MSKLRKSHRRVDETSQIPARANRILNIILVGLVLIILRVWHLTVVQYDEKLEESRKPQRRTVLEPAKRGTIRDRFNIPLALNKLQYNISILYSQIRQVPTVAWKTDPDGKRRKQFVRKEYISSLSKLLGKELEMDPGRIEDLIYAKAALYNQIPFTLQDNISEQQYYRLKMLEKDWPGIQVQRVPVRYYPMGQVAADIVGYMGAINRQEYETVIQEMKALETYFQSVDIGEVVSLPEGIETTEAGRRRLKDLQELAYSMNDSIGKGGVEGRLEYELRGFRGKKSYYSDARGNILQELPGTRDPIPGKRVLLTISSELQEYAEQLLVENEHIRQPCMSRLGSVKRTITSDKNPWIKGGAIVAMDPNSGEILAMASHPRFNPNDFIACGTAEETKKKKAKILKWLEHESYLGDIWDMQRPFEREVFTPAEGIYLEERWLTWSDYLDLVLAKKAGARHNLLFKGTVRDACMIQNSYDKLTALIPGQAAYHLFGLLYQDLDNQEQGNKKSSREREEIRALLSEHTEEIEEIKTILDTYFKDMDSIYDQVLVMDILRTVVDGDRFSPELLKMIGDQTLSDYKTMIGAMVTVRKVVKTMMQERFHEIDFHAWRQANEKSFLKQKRLEEKQERRYAKPYIDYLDSLEQEMFQAFWQEHQWTFLLAFLEGCDSVGHNSEPFLVFYLDHLQEWNEEIRNGAHQQADWIQAYMKLNGILKKLPGDLAISYLQTLREFKQLERPLLGKYRHLRKGKDGIQREKDLAAAFYPKYGYGYGRSQAYRQAATQGSIFKLVTAYEALVQRYHQLKDTVKTFDLLNPLNIDDRVTRRGKELFVGFHADGSPITRYYKGGRMPRSLSAKIGEIDVLKALERSSNPYFALLAVDVLNSPNDLAEAARRFSFGSKTGIDLPGEIGGNIPNDLETNPTGVHSFSIGQHTLVVTPLQTSVMLSSLVNGGKVFKPQIVKLLIGKEPKRGRELMADHSHFPYQEELALVGIDFPLFSASDAEQQKSLVKRIAPQVKRHIFLPDEVQKILVEGMRLVVERTQGQSLRSLARLYHKAPNAIRDYVELKAQLIGKTSTAESVENIDLELKEGTNLYTHVWFGGISYDQDLSEGDHPHQFLFRDFAGKPELVVVVYLRYGGYGKEAAPVAAQMAKKWKEIKQRRV